MLDQVACKLGSSYDYALTNVSRIPLQFWLIFNIVAVALPSISCSQHNVVPFCSLPLCGFGGGVTVQVIVVMVIGIRKCMEMRRTNKTMDLGLELREASMY